MPLSLPTALRAVGFYGAVAIMFAALISLSASAQEPLPWRGDGGATRDRYDSDSRSDNSRQFDNGYRANESYRANDSYRPSVSDRSDAYRPRSDAYPQQAERDRYERDDSYRSRDLGRDARSADDYGDRDGGRNGDQADYGEPYSDAPRDDGRDGDRYEGGPPYREDRGTYSQSEIMTAGHGFFGSVSKGLASVVEHAFRKSGRPNGYILGEDAGGAFVAGLRYGEGTLYTKEAGDHRVFWQGPSIGYDFGGEGSKTMVLVYNLRDPSEIFHRYAGVQGSAYLVGGVSIQYQQYGDVVLAPIRSGVGVRLGANVGYLKYTRSPTWNPF